MANAPAPPAAAALSPAPCGGSAPSARTDRGPTFAPAPALVTEAPQPVRPGPHVAVTSRVVLQPNPSFAAGAAPARAAKSPPGSPSSALAKSSAAASSSASTSPTAAAASGASSAAARQQGTVFSKAAAAFNRSAGNPVKQNKNELLESMTKQLQLILTKLNDTTLSDQTREKYQALAQKIQMQMGKISRPQPAPRGPPVFRRKF